MLLQSNEVVSLHLQSASLATLAQLKCTGQLAFGSGTHRTHWPKCFRVGLVPGTGLRVLTSYTIDRGVWLVQIHVMHCIEGSYRAGMWDALLVSWKIWVLFPALLQTSYVILSKLLRWLILEMHWELWVYTALKIWLLTFQYLSLPICKTGIILHLAHRGLVRLHLLTLIKYLEILKLKVLWKCIHLLLITLFIILYVVGGGLLGVESCA